MIYQRTPRLAVEESASHRPGAAPFFWVSKGIDMTDGIGWDKALLASNRPGTTADCASATPQFWVDHKGSAWIEPKIKGRLKVRIPSHRALREYVIARDGGKCKECGSNEKLVADHIVSRRNGGRHHPSNMQCLCDSCNARKAGKVDAKGGNHA